MSVQQKQCHCQSLLAPLPLGPETQIDRPNCDFGRVRRFNPRALCWSVNNCPNLERSRVESVSVFVNLVPLWSAKLKDFIAWFLMNVLWQFKIIWIMDISGVQNHKEHFTQWRVFRLLCFYLCHMNYSSKPRTSRWTAHIHVDFDLLISFAQFPSRSISLPYFNHTSVLRK